MADDSWICCNGEGVAVLDVRSLVVVRLKAAWFAN